MELMDNRMKVRIMACEGFGAALFGMGLSHGLTSIDWDGEKPDGTEDELGDRLIRRADLLAPKDGGHNKFLESVFAWILIKAPRYWWQEMDTYRVGITKQSESTMHTLGKRDLEFSDFQGGINFKILNELNDGLHNCGFQFIKRHLPESFLQTRQICVNYKTLRNIVKQRSNHRLPEWKTFIDAVKKLPKAEEWIFA